MADVQTQYATTEDGVSIAYAVIGTGPPVVSFGAGFGDLHLHISIQGFPNPTEEMAAAGRSVVLFDGRGSGASDRTPLADSLEPRLLDLQAVVDAARLRSFDLLGIIHGSAPAIAYAVRNPDRVRRLILSNGYARGTDYYGATPYTRGLKFLAGMAVEDWEFFCLTVAHWVTAFANPEIAHAVAASMQTGASPEAYAKLTEVADSTDITNLLPQVAVPTLVLRDNSLPFAAAPEVSKPLAARIPGARLVTTSTRDEATAAILQFLREGDSQPGAAAHPASAPVASVVTVLFTDIVGHTEMMRRLGDAKGREVLREHERITREVLSQHGGTEVKTMGDGFMASFGSVTKAVKCAVALQRAMEGGNGQLEMGNGERIQVRCGLNAGEPIEDEGDLFGSSVILASRIAAKAQGGEILASLAVRELCSGKGFLFADLGDHELRGFEDPVRVFEVKWRE